MQQVSLFFYSGRCSFGVKQDGQFRNGIETFKMRLELVGFKGKRCHSPLRLQRSPTILHENEKFEPLCAPAKSLYWVGWRKGEEIEESNTLDASKLHNDTGNRCDAAADENAIGSLKITAFHGGTDDMLSF